MKTIVIGAGPAGIAACLRLKQLLPKDEIILLEAGKCLSERIEQLKQTDICNGFGGAGLFSDRKLSIIPAGSGMFDKNLYELKDSYLRTLWTIKLGLVSDQIDELINKMSMFLKTQTSEDFERELSELNAGTLKTYPTVVLNQFSDAIKILEYYEYQLNELGVNIKYNTTVVDITPCNNNGSVEYLVTLKSGDVIYAQKVIMAMGRFGPIQNIINNIVDKRYYSHNKRLEIGVRVKVDNYPELVQAIVDLKQQDPLCQDPKFKITKSFIIGGKDVVCEFRTFCVCVPNTTQEGYQEGYSVVSKDLVTGLTSVSGSSSFDELSLRNDNSCVDSGSNIGFMMRICDPDVLDKEIANVMTKYTFTQRDKYSTTLLDNFEEAIKDLSLAFPLDLCYPLYDGVISLLKHIIRVDMLDKPISVLFPCIEGVGSYPITNSEFQLKGMNNMYVVGDMVGHTRGLIQGFVGGDMVGKIIYTKQKEEEMKLRNNLRSYQSILMPTYHYNKVIHGDIEANRYNVLKEWIKSEKNLKDEYNEKIRARAYDICNNINHVKFVGSLDSIGVLYELHHFFLDSKIYPETERLDYITTSSLSDYISMCNAINDSMDDIKEILYEMMDIDDNPTWFEHKEEFMNNIQRTIDNYKFKSCVLSLRTRKSIEERDKYTDIPVMQSAYHFNPVPSKVYRDKQFEDVHNVEILLVSFMCAILDIFIGEMINIHSLKLILGRTKIETQEPSIKMADENTLPLYLECHVKVHITGKDGSKISYVDKKNIIQKLASLVEGVDAVEKEIFNTMAVSINLLKHPEYGQQFFLTYRSTDPESMAFIRHYFKSVMNILCELDTNNELCKYKFVFVPDSEFVVYDNNRDLDLPWFPITTNFLTENYKERIHELTNATHHIFMVTSNENKVYEIKKLFNSHDVPICLHICYKKFDDIMTSSVLQVTEDKANKAYSSIFKPVVVETTGLKIEGCNEYPGALVEHFYNHFGPDEICKLYGGTKATAETVIVCKNSYGTTNHTSYVTGTISTEPRGKNGFGWDNIFVPTNFDKTFAEMTVDEKNMISMRKDAYMKLFQLNPLNENDMSIGI